MTDRTVLFEDLLSLRSLRARTYVLVEPAGTGLACIDLSARSCGGWYFARRWFLVREGRRLLFRTLDRVEAAGFRFQVRTAKRENRASPPDPPTGQASIRASEFYRSLDEAERGVHRSLFPDEADLLHEGYDWDARGVFRGGAPIPPDPFGRVLESTEEFLYEWVRIPDEATWRRYPLERLKRLNPAARGIER